MKTVKRKVLIWMKIQIWVMKTTQSRRKRKKRRRRRKRTVTLRRRMKRRKKKELWRKGKSQLYGSKVSNNLNLKECYVWKEYIVWWDRNEVIYACYTKLVIKFSACFKEVLSVLMLCTPVFIFTSGSSALLGHPRCGLSIWLSLLAIFNTLFWVYANFFHEKTDKTRKYSKSAIFVR